MVAVRRGIHCSIMSLLLGAWSLTERSAHDALGDRARAAMVRQLAADGAPARFERSRGRLWICGDAQKSAEGEGGEAILVAEGFVAQGEQRLEEIVGLVETDEVLARVFATFCVGK